MTKDQEISTLRELSQNDTYFADTFTKEDVNQMVSNIAKDFPILLNTGWVKIKSENQRNAVKKALKMAIETLLKEHKSNPSKELENDISDIIFFENRI